MKRKSTVILCIFICCNFLFAAQYAKSDLTQDWKFEHVHSTRSIGVDAENNLLSFYIANIDGDLTRTRLIKCSTAGEIVYNDSIAFGNGYFLYVQKWMDFNGNLYLVGISSHEINIYVFDNQLKLSNYLFINETDFEGSMSLINVFITNMGNIYLRTSYYSFYINSTHMEKKDYLYKIDSDGNFVWAKNFQTIIPLWSDLENSVSEYDQDYCYFSYHNMLYKIKSSNGKIVWEREFSDRIQGIAASVNGIVVISGEESKHAHMTLQYLSTKGKMKWSKTISSDYGYLDLLRVEAKKYSISLSFSDLGDDGLHGEGSDRLFVYNLDGEELVNKKWDYWSYFWERQHIHLTYNNSVFVHHVDYGSVTFSNITYYSFENNMTTIAAIDSFYIGFVICAVSLPVLIRKRKLKKHKNNN